MSGIDWKRINAARIRQGPLASDDRYGFNGAFEFHLNGIELAVIASNGGGWEHVSVSMPNSCGTPSWSVMQQIKEIFWGEELTVMQLHPPKSRWINNHPGCLHLWRRPHEDIPLPPGEMVGLKNFKFDAQA